MDEIRRNTVSIDGFAKHMRDALFERVVHRFTGTPRESGDKNTQAVLGDHIDVYNILQSKEDKGLRADSLRSAAGED